MAEQTCETKEAKNGAFMLENITKRNQKLLNLAKEWASKNGLRFAWDSNAIILLKMDEVDRIIVVKSEARIVTI